jgi:O-antigen ligase
MDMSEYLALQVLHINRGIGEIIGSDLICQRFLQVLFNTATLLIYTDRQPVVINLHVLSDLLKLFHAFVVLVLFLLGLIVQVEVVSQILHLHRVKPID